MWRRLFLSTALLLLLLVLILVAGSSLAQERGVTPPEVAAIASSCSEAVDCPSMVTSCVDDGDCDDLDQGVTTTHFAVLFTTDPGSSNRIHNRTEAEEVSRQLEAAWDTYVNDPNYGFRAPEGTTTEPIPVYIWAYNHQGCGCLNVRYMYLNNAFIRNNLPANVWEVEQLTAHELFHRVQYSYDKGPEDKWVFEGTASTMQDKVFPDPDGHVPSSYLNRANAYLADPNDDWWYGADKHPYHAQLYWTYYLQRCGTVVDETALGMDAMRIFWEKTLDYDKVEAMDHAIQDAPGCPELDSMVELFQDFSVANYVKQMNSVDAHYTYADERGPLGTVYDDVGIEHGRETVSPASPMDHTSQIVRRWGVLYFVGEPTAACHWVRVELDGQPGDKLMYSILSVDGGRPLHYDDPHFRHYGEDMVRTLYNRGLDEVVAIAAADEWQARTSVHMSCVEPSLTILSPRAGSGVATAGAPLEPRRFIVKVAVTSGGEHVDGLSPGLFDVRVGGKEAHIVASLPVDNQYWLVVNPPTQTVTTGGPWLFGLEVRLEGIRAERLNSVQYEEQAYFDKVLVIDTSGSMANPAGQPKLQAAQNAALLFVEELASEDNLGLIEFNTTARSLLDGMHEANATTRADARTEIRNLDADGFTTIGGGLTLALGDLDHPNPAVAGDPDKRDAIVLLSDGLENENPCYEARPELWWLNRCTPPYVRSIITDSEVPVHTIALGPGAHEDLMQRIAEDTDGDYWFAQVVTNGSSVLAGPQQAVANWRLGLSDIYDRLEGDIEGRTRIHQEQRSVSVIGTYAVQVPIDVSVHHATFAVVVDANLALVDPKVWLENPSGQGNPAVLPPGVVHREEQDHHYHVFEASFPEPGVWEVWVGVSPLCSSPPCEYAVLASGMSAELVEVYVGTAVQARLAGTTIPILAVYYGQAGLLSGATMTAQVVGNGMTYNLTLRDDGYHGDGAAGDGVYGGYFTQATTDNWLGGSYVVHVQGVSSGGTTRQATASFHVEPDADDDGDGLPNGYEERHGLDPDSDDAGQDPDHDRLTTGEEYELGTNPRVADTDHGGESDKSEEDGGRDPVNNPDDDLLVTPTGIEAVARNGAVILRYDPRAGYHKVLAYWSTNPDMPDWLGHEIDVGTSGEYVHTGRTNGTTYHYFLVARDSSGNYSGNSVQVSATPKLDPYPPGGMVTINDDAQSTRDRKVTLTVRADDDSSMEFDGTGGPNQDPPPQMRLSNRPDMGGASWQPFKTTKSWTLGYDWGESYVYVQFRDAEGNVSSVEYDSIWLLPRVYLSLIQRKK